MRFWDVLQSIVRRGGRSRAMAGGKGATVATLDVEMTEEAEEDAASEQWWTPAQDALLAMAPAVCPVVSTEALALDRILSSYSARLDVRLPSLPRVAERVLRLLGGKAYDARRIAEEVADDQVISAAVLRLANCPLYARYEHAHDLRTAVARLGVNAIRSLMLQHSLQAAAQRGRGSDRRLGAIVWNGSLASACIMRAIAGPTRVDPEAAYLTGLVHDIGNLLVLQEVQEQQALLGYRIALDEFVWLCIQHHQRLGQLIASAWELPEELKVIAANHHRPITDHEIAPREVAMLALTDMIKCMLGYAPLGSFDLLGSHAARALGLGDAPELARCLDELPSELRHIPATF